MASLQTKRLAALPGTLVSSHGHRTQRARRLKTTRLVVRDARKMTAHGVRSNTRRTRARERSRRTTWVDGWMDGGMNDTRRHHITAQESGSSPTWVSRSVGGVGFEWSGVRQQHTKLHRLDDRHFDTHYTMQTGREKGETDR
mmetsp:Transcript_16525/g.39669  ORF Transcript_16525/g.39669 Transcript_16525/m.39669 type:complete len:142 (-) Transcript_16525:365-790(-)